MRAQLRLKRACSKAPLYCGGHIFRIKKGVVDALRPDWVAVIAGIADQRPTRSVRLPVEIRQVHGTLYAPDVPRCSDSAGKLRAVIESRKEIALHGLTKFGDQCAAYHKIDHRQPVIRRRDEELARRPRVQLEGFAVRLTVDRIGVVACGHGWSRIVLGGTCGARKRRISSVSADDDRTPRFKSLS